MKLKELENMVSEELQKFNELNEQLSPQDEDKIRDLIRSEVSAIFFDLFKKRKVWGA